MILSISAAVKSLPYMRRKSCPRNCEGLSGCLPIFIPEITSFLPESYILLAILNRSEGVRDNNISSYRCFICVGVSLIFSLRLS